MCEQNKWVDKYFLHQGQVPQIRCFCMPERECNQKLYPRTQNVSYPLPEDINKNNSIDMRLNIQLILTDIRFFLKQSFVH